MKTSGCVLCTVFCNQPSFSLGAQANPQQQQQQWDNKLIGWQPEEGGREGGRTEGQAIQASKWRQDVLMTMPLSSSLQIGGKEWGGGWIRRRSGKGNDGYLGTTYMWKKKTSASSSLSSSSTALKWQQEKVFSKFAPRIPFFFWFDSKQDARYLTVKKDEVAVASDAGKRVRKKKIGSWGGGELWRREEGGHARNVDKQRLAPTNIFDARSFLRLKFICQANISGGFG